MLTTTGPLKAVLWDFDGVLNRNFAGGQFLWTTDFEADFARPLDDFNRSVFRDPLPLLRGEADIADRIADWIAEAGVETTPEAVIDYWLSRDFHPDRQVLALVERLRAKGVAQAILTNCDRRRADWLDTLLPRLGGIDLLFASARLGAAKPEARAYLRAAEGLGLSPQSILFVDDTPANVNAAAGLGFRSFLYSPLAFDALKRQLPR